MKIRYLIQSRVHIDGANIPNYSDNGYLSWTIGQIGVYIDNKRLYLCHNGDYHIEFDANFPYGQRFFLSYTENFSGVFHRELTTATLLFCKCPNGLYWFFRDNCELQFQVGNLSAFVTLPQW